jgi:hypothetical protein
MTLMELLALISATEKSNAIQRNGTGLSIGGPSTQIATRHDAGDVLGGRSALISEAEEGR